MRLLGRTKDDCLTEPSLGEAPRGGGARMLDLVSHPIGFAPQFCSATFACPSNVSRLPCSPKK